MKTSRKRPNRGGGRDVPQSSREARAELTRLAELLVILDAFDVRRLRTTLGLTQAAVARMVEVPERTLRSWEHGERMPGFESLKKFCDRLKALGESR
jgi:DNA-binding transcriptional regulator YiaG